NQLVITGDCPKLLVLEQQILEQLSTLALDYGARPISATAETAVAPRHYDLKSAETLLGHLYTISYDVDLSPEELQKHIIMPTAWHRGLTTTGPDKLVINLAITTPTLSKNTNGTYGPTNNTINWQLIAGRHNKLEACYEVIDPARICLLMLILIA